jgi:hypothetical protein
VGPTDESPKAFQSARAQEGLRTTARAHSQRPLPVPVSPLRALALSWTQTEVPNHEPNVAPSQTPDQLPNNIPNVIPSLASEATARVKLRELIDKTPKRTERRRLRQPLSGLAAILEEICMPTWATSPTARPICSTSYGDMELQWA